MKVSSLVKLFGIATAGFVPQAQANPFGISFMKVDPPKDKKGEAICFRLKLSQTDVFSEHNFTDITFRPDTTVFLQRNMVIDDEEEILKKTFKNFNAEKDPFEIPEKYLPLEDKDRADWVDKDGKPLKFLVVVGESETFQFKGCNLYISSNPKQPAFRIAGRITFLGTVDCIRTEYPVYYSNEQLEEAKKREINPKQSIGCILSENALQGFYMNLRQFKGVRCLFHTDGNFFQASHLPTDSYFEGKLADTTIRSPFFECRSFSVDQYSRPSIGDAWNNDKGDFIVIVVWNASQKSAKYSKVGFDSEEHISVTIVSKGEWIISVDVFREVDSMRTCLVNSFTGGSREELYKLIAEDKVDHEDAVKLSLKVHAFGFFFPKEQAQPNK